MTTQELRELDAWIAEHVMGWHYSKSIIELNANVGAFLLSDKKQVIKPDGDLNLFFIPTERSKDAMDVLKKCAEKYDCHSIRFADKWYVGARNVVAVNESLETGICLLAKELFSQTTTK